MPIRMLRGGLRECVRHGGNLASDYCLHQFTRLGRCWQREEQYKDYYEHQRQQEQHDETADE